MEHDIEDCLLPATVLSSTMEIGKDHLWLFSIRFTHSLGENEACLFVHLLFKSCVFIFQKPIISQVNGYPSFQYQRKITLYQGII